ncbi:MAG: peptide-methionine (S)-S-oxide reductase MsrA [Pseudomonadota bacterium]|nr:peptide-methionine (S)-S-oxide reductase MsrA [Pseudomonadota bacterium]
MWHRLLAALTLAAILAVPARAGDTKTAVFAGGCFWCMEEAFEKVDGVVETISGYTGGEKVNPTYNDVSWGNTGHYEAVEVKYDPAKVTYEKLLDIFWHNIDPTDRGGQFCDRGMPYRTGVFAVDDAQLKLAEKTKADVATKLGKTIYTDVKPLTKFWPAEDYHQDYYKTNSGKYGYYKWACGRAQRLEQLWGPKS